MDGTDLKESLLKEQTDVLKEQDRKLDLLANRGLKVLKNQMNLISAEINDQSQRIDEIEDGVEKYRSFNFNNI